MRVFGQVYKTRDESNQRKCCHVDEVILTVIAEVKSFLNFLEFSAPANCVWREQYTSATDVSVLTPNHFPHGPTRANLIPACFSKFYDGARDCSKF